MRPATKRKKRRKTYSRRRVGARIRPLAVLPNLGELAVGDVVHHVRHLGMRHLPGAQPARVEAAAHLANHVRPALEWKYPALHEGGHQVGSSQALRLDHHPEPGDGCVPGLRQRPGPVAPRRLPPSRWAGYVSRQVDVVALLGDVLHVKVGLLPELHRLDQQDGWERIVLARPPHGNEGSAGGGHARDDGAELALEEFPPELESGENPKKALTQGDESR